MKVLDPRLNAMRPDLADETLRGQIDAQHFVTGIKFQISRPIVSVLKRPEKDAPQTTQALLGEICLVFENKNGWAWVKLLRDSYVGYVEASALNSEIVAPTHKVLVPSTLVYPKPDIKSGPVQFLPRHAQVAVTSQNGTFAAGHSGGFIFAAHLAALNAKAQDFVAIAEDYLNVPYYWGGKSIYGTDCSGLVQTALQACGIEAPRDSDMQENALGHLVADHHNLRRGDLIFWSGHVGIMQNATQLLHANGHTMKTTSETLADVVSRSDKPISSIKRMA